jgi:hypothetical protein
MRNDFHSARAHIQSDFADDRLPALARIGVTGKQIGWHSFRHSLATNLRSLGVDIKVAQELMRHSSCRTTLDIYTRAVSQQKREASLKVVELMLPLDLKKFQHPSAPSETEETPNQQLQQTHCRRFIGGPDRDRTDDLFDAILWDQPVSLPPILTASSG